MLGLARFELQRFTMALTGGTGYTPALRGPIEVMEPEDVLGIGRGSDILVVDDSPSNLTAYEAALHPLGRKLVLAGSGMEALSRLLEQDFALLILDVSMPEMSGIETARLVRERPRNKLLPIIFITGMTWQNDIILEAYKVGAFDFMVKPIPPEVLRAKARVYLQLQECTQDVLRQAERLRASEHRELASEAEGQRKSEFLAMLGHELRNPLSAITSAVELLKHREVPQSRELTILDRQIEHMNRLVSDLVDISRITRGKISLRREVVELSGCVAQTVDATRPLFDKHLHELVVHCPEQLFVDADRHRLCQVLGNLLTNAAKYTPDGGRVVLTADALRDSVRISVRDNGRGITEPLLSSLFDMFVQGDRTLDRTEGGLGVGLTFVRNIVELHGGAVTVRSPGQGAGSTFEIEWPRAIPDPPATDPFAVPEIRRGGSQLRVLIVDDNADAADLLAEVIRVLGQDATVAYGGDSALELAAASPPDVALLDIGMPGLDGYELAGRLRKVPGCAEAVLIAVTGYGQPSDVERSRHAGFAHHVVKPIDIHTLAKLLDLSL